MRQQLDINYSLHLHLQRFLAPSTCRFFISESIGSSRRTNVRIMHSDGLPSYSAAHQAAFAAKNPLDKHSVHINDVCLNNKATFRNGSTGCSADSKVGSTHQIHTRP